MPRVRYHRRGKQNPPASVAQTETPRSSSRLENPPGIRSEIVPLPLGAPSRPPHVAGRELIYIIWGSLGQRDKPLQYNQRGRVPLKGTDDLFRRAKHFCFEG